MRTLCARHSCSAATRGSTPLSAISTQTERSHTTCVTTLPPHRPHASTCAPFAVFCCTLTPRLFAFCRQHLSQILDQTRLHLFEIITQFRAIFVDDDTHTPHTPSLLTTIGAVSNGTGSGAAPDRGLLYQWVSQRMATVVATLKRALPSIDGALLANVLEQCMYCGLALARVGLDFRGLLPPLIEARVVDLFRATVSPSAEAFAQALDDYAWRMDARALAKIGIAPTPTAAPPSAAASAIDGDAKNGTAESDAAAAFTFQTHSSPSRGRRFRV
jgi:hypothetical protein